MTKLIEIPDDIVIALKVKAAQENTSLKKWIENQLVKMASDTQMLNNQITKPKN